MEPSDLRHHQLEKFREQIQWASDHSPFYARQLAAVDPAEIQSLADVRTLPTTSKAALQAAQADGDARFGDLLSVDPTDIVSYHQTSGTTGRPLRQADNRQDWEWWASCWATVLWAAGVRPTDRVFLPFSYTVFIGFWAGHYAAERIGAEVIPGGGMRSAERIELIETVYPTTMLTTPTYALRLAEVAEEAGIDPASTSIERIICAGEIGASVPATKARIERTWGAKLYDHAGATETGAWSYDCGDVSPGLHFNEGAFLIEILDDRDQPVDVGERGRLVVTPLDRRAQPVIRFEQADLVERGERTCSCGRTHLTAPGGILGRIDDFRTVNGVLFSPRMVEDVIRRVDGLTPRYHITLEQHESKDLDVATVQVEADPQAPRPRKVLIDEVQARLKHACGLSVRVNLHAVGELHQSEMKADRLQDEREIHA